MGCEKDLRTGGRNIVASSADFTASDIWMIV
jgi:hypothetical protein